MDLLQYGISYLADVKQWIQDEPGWETNDQDLIAAWKATDDALAALRRYREEN